MTSLIPSLKLFPIYRNGPILDGKNGLNADSSFVIPATRYRSTYAVNVTPDSSPYDPNNYLALGPDKGHRLTSRPISAASDYTTLLSLNSSVPGHLATTTAPTTAPDIPASFKKRASYYTVTDANYDFLMAQPSFRIPGIGMGLLVTTDGHGGVQSESLDPGVFGTMTRANAIGHNLGSPNRADISIKATNKVNDPGFSFGDVYAVENPNGPRKTAPTKNLAGPAAGLNGLNATGKNAALFNSGGISTIGVTNPSGIGAGLNDLNPVQARLDQLQPPDNGLALAGADAALGPEQAQQVATSQADYGLTVSSNYYQQMASVASAADLQRQNSYAATYAPRLDHVLDGRVNVIPWQAPTNALSATPAPLDHAVRLPMSGALADATASQGKNSYIPFNMQGGGSSAGGNSGGSGGYSDPNPFAGQRGFQSGMQGGMSSGGHNGGSAAGYKMPSPRKTLLYKA